MLHLATRLSEKDLSVDLLTGRGAELSNRFRFAVHPIMPNWSWSELPRLMRFLRSRSPEGIFLEYSGWLYDEHPMITFAPTVSKWILPHTPFITQFGIVGGSYPEKKSLAVRAARKALSAASGREGVDYHFGTLLRDSDSLIAHAEIHASMLVDLHPAAGRKLMVIPPPPILHMVPDNGGESRHRGRAILGFAESDFIVAYFGVIYRSKGLETLLKAFQKVATRRENARLALIGGQSNAMDGLAYFNEICDLSRQLSIDHRMVAREYDWDSSDGSLYLRAADVCVLPFDDGVTLNRSSLAGAAEHGLPIITTKGETLESPFIDGRNMLLCRPRDPDCLALAIERIAEDFDLRRRLSEGASTLAGEWFSWDRAIDRTIAALSGEVGSARTVGAAPV